MDTQSISQNKKIVNAKESKRHGVFSSSNEQTNETNYKEFVNFMNFISSLCEPEGMDKQL